MSSVTANVVNNSVTANVVNNTDLTFIASANPPSHGLTPTILNPTVKPGTTPNVFVANSDGAGVEGSVSLKGGGVEFQLIYDNPVAGPNTGSVTAPSGYTGRWQYGSGTNATFTYTIGPA
jgi:hypothetical protein